MSTAVDVLQNEVTNLHDHNQALMRELTDLKKERLAWKEKEPQFNTLESSVSRLTQELQVTRSENARLRKQNDELQKNLDTETAEFADARQRWSDKEQALLVAAKADRVKLKELRDLYNVREHKSYDTVEVAYGTPQPSRESSPLRSETLAVMEENIKLKAELELVMSQLSLKDLKIQKQESDISELQRNVEHLMDEVELYQEHAQQLPSESDDEEHSNTLGINHSLLPAKSMGSLAEEYARMNEPAPTATSQSSLRAKCAALGLSTEGNRAILKKRLERHATKKKKQAEKAGSQKAN
ncbi:hypothetical protein HDU97_008645 [Phlyctochytrium planicorne]|nr:hypothetical protein HDU97_008645 [Phlyctochytrium planicorne]